MTNTSIDAVACANRLKWVRMFSTPSVAYGVPSVILSVVKIQKY